MKEADYLALSDEALVELSHSGDSRADELLCERYKNMVRIKARPYFLMGADREDLLQEGMIGLYKAIRDYSPEHSMSFRSFADLCILRQIITAIKRATRKKHAPLNSYISIYRTVEDERERPLIDTMSGVRTEDPEELFISRESLAGMQDMLDQMLSQLEKEVLTLFLDGRSYQEIAARLGRGTKTVDNALQRIKKKLESYLRESNG